MQKPIFRQTALERLSSPEQLDQLMPVTSLRGWLALLAVLGLVVALVTWSLIDRVPVQVSGRGMLIRGGQIMPIVAPLAGQVEALYVHTGDDVLAGQIIAHVRSLSDLSAPAVEIQSFVAGQVVEVLAAPGSAVAAGSVLATLEDTRQPLEAVIYVPAAVGYTLRAGMAVEISPDNLSREVYGYVRGVVRSVGVFPASTPAMYAVLANDRLVQEFSANGAPIEVRVTLLNWSGAGAPSDLILSGALCTARFTLAERRPIELLLPSR